MSNFNCNFITYHNYILFCFIIHNSGQEINKLIATFTDNTYSPIDINNQLYSKTNGSSCLSIMVSMKACLCLQLPELTHTRFKNFQTQRYAYFTKKNLQYEQNSTSVFSVVQNRMLQTLNQVNFYCQALKNEVKIGKKHNFEDT
jgi:hypothetical protein